MHPSANRFLQWLGAIVAGVGVCFVSYRLYYYAHPLDLVGLDVAHWSFLFALTVSYGVANVFLALAWKHLLSFCGVRISTSDAVGLYGVSQLGKYIPGNIFQFASRQGLGLAAGISGKALARSVVWELGLMSVTGAIFGALVLPLVWHGAVSQAGVLVFSALLAALVAITYLRFGRSVAVAGLYFASFLLVAGTIFFSLLWSLSGAEPRNLTLSLATVGAYTIAWLIGLLTPGAPAGLGVRELVLLALLDGEVGEDALITAVAFSRVITALGDTLFFGCAWFVASKAQRRR